MGTLVNRISCKECKEESGIILEWLSPDKAIEEIKKTKCPNCNSANWYFLDTCEH